MPDTPDTPDFPGPAEPGIDYARLAQEALRGVARLALDQIARDGLPGEHHLYLSFKTTAPGVRLPPFLVDLHPDEMSIVLQQQFWDLFVDREAFSVTLAFGGSRHSLTVPFAALTTFVDPSVPFGLRWEDRESSPVEAEGTAATAEEAEAEGEAQGEHSAEEPSSGSGTVVRFDRFRRGPES